MIEKVVFVIPPQTHPLDITGPAQLFFESTEYGAEIDLFYVTSTNDSEIKSSIGLHYSRLSRFEDFLLTKNDLIFIPGITGTLLVDEDFLETQEPFFIWLRQQYENGATICSICTGSYLLAAAGLLDHKKATTHWKFMDSFRERFPTIEFQSNCLFVENERLYTSAGMSSGIDLCLYLIEKEYGTKFAIDIAKEVVLYFRRGDSDPQLSIFLQYRNHLENRIHDAQDYIVDRLSESLRIEHLAEEVNMSARNFTRLFKKTVGITVNNYINKLRVERSVQLLGQGEKLDFIASQCGLNSPDQLRNLLKKYKGLLPTEISAIK